MSGYNQPLNNTTTRRLGAAVRPRPPLGDGMNAGASKAIARRLAADGINTMTSGLPVNLTLLARRRRSGQRRADLPAEPRRRRLRADGAAIDNYFNPATSSIPTDRTQPFGNAPRNVGARPGDLLARPRPAQGLRARLGDARARVPHRGVQRAQQDQLRRAERQPSSTAFGTIRTLSTTPRQIQLGVKVDF